LLACATTPHTILASPALRALPSITIARYL
jgi:hypothetical protein